MPVPASRSDPRRVLSLVWAERGAYLPGLFFVVVGIGTALVYPQVIRLIIDDGIQGGQVQRLNQLSLWMVAILIVEAVATGARDYYFGLGAERVGVRLRRMSLRDAARAGHPVLRPAATSARSRRASGRTCRRSNTCSAKSWPIR